MKTIVFVDDEPLALQDLAEILPWNDLGYSVAACCTDPNDAVRKITAIQPDVVFTDIRMPGMSGLDLISAVRAANISPEFVIISSYSDFAVAQKAIVYDICQYLLKPFDREDVKEAVSRLQNKMDRKNSSSLRGLKSDFSLSPEEIRIFNEIPGDKSYFCIASDKQILSENWNRILHVRVNPEAGVWFYLCAISRTAKSMVKVLCKDGQHIGMSRFHSDYSQMQKLINEANASLEGNFFYSDHQLCSDIQDYICENYMHRLFLHEIAAKFFISHTYLCELFKKHTGTTITAFINQIRLNHAVLLLSGEKELKEIAEENGFQDYNYFRKMFKRKFSISPENYRKSL